MTRNLKFPDHSRFCGTDVHVVAPDILIHPTKSGVIRKF